MPEAIIEQTIACHRRNELGRAMALCEEVLAGGQHPDGAGRLLGKLGLGPVSPQLPPQRRKNRLEANPEWLAHVQKAPTAIDIAPKACAFRYIEQGRRLAVTEAGPPT